MALRPQQLHLTHYGPVSDVPRLGALMLPHIDAVVGVALGAAAEANRHAALKAGLAALCRCSLCEHGSTIGEAALLDLLALHIEPNAQGVGIWLDGRQRSDASKAPVGDGG